MRPWPTLHLYVQAPHVHIEFMAPCLERFMAGVTLNRSLYETVLRELLLERAEHTVELYEGSGSAWRKVRCIFAIVQPLSALAHADTGWLTKLTPEQARCLPCDEAQATLHSRSAQCDDGELLCGRLACAARKHNMQ